jgi:hypothetical protein
LLGSRSIIIVCWLTGRGSVKDRNEAREIEIVTLGNLLCHDCLPLTMASELKLFVFVIGLVESPFSVCIPDSESVQVHFKRETHSPHCFIDGHVECWRNNFEAKHSTRYFRRVTTLGKVDERFIFSDTNYTRGIGKNQSV